MNTRTNQIVKAMQNSRGRFFGLTTVQGNAINGRFVSQTPKYVRVYDRNLNRKVTLAKTSLACYRQGETVIG